MSREDIVAVAIRLFAIFLVVTAVRFAFGALAANKLMEMGSAPIVAAAALSLSTLVAAIVLWMFPVSIARKLLPSMRDSGPALHTDARHVQVIAFSVLGMWLLATAVGDASYWLSLAVFTLGNSASGFVYDVDTKAAMLATVIELAIGLALLLGARGLVGVIYRLRYGNDPVVAKGDPAA